MSETFLPAYEVLHLTGLAAGALVDLLSRGLIRFRAGANGELLLDLDSITPELIARHGLADDHGAEQSSHERLIEELVASAVLKTMGGIVEESFLLARQWLPAGDADAVAEIPPSGAGEPE